MSTEEKMTIDEQRKYLRTMKKRYVKADRKEQQFSIWNEYRSIA